MKRLCTLLLAAGLLLAAFTGSASAEGFALYEWGARGNALGGSMVGRADDPSAVAFNPAGITQLEGTHVMGGFSAIIPSSTVEINHGGKSYEGEGAFNVWVPPHGYMTTQLSDNMWLGMGIYTRFGLGSEYDDSSWGGRYNIYNVGIQTVSFNPNLAFKLTDDLSAAIGVEVMGLKLDMKKKINPTGKGSNAPGTPPASGDIDSDLQADSYGVGLTAGLHYRLNDQWAAGVSYKSQVKHKARGTNDFSNVPGGLQNIYADCDVNGVVILPDMISFGVVYYPTPEWSIEAGATLTRWSLYDNLPIYHSAPFYNGAGAMVNSEKEWNDAWRYNVGVEYKATDWMDLRVGYVYDVSPVDDDHVDYLIPTQDRQLYSTGVGFHWDSYTVDLSYTYIVASEVEYSQRTSEGIFEGNSKGGRTHVLGLSVGYTF
ncbi:MAG TPA: hypothetical protein DEF41_15430 [Desulfovibrio sp.]|nr:hypothetical protein [Desulfovibrio sp.]